MGIIYKYKKYHKESVNKKKTLFQTLLLSPIYLYFFINERVLPAKISILLTFRRVCGFFPDLKNPKTLNEKLQWKKLHDHKKIYQTCSDKYEVRKFVEKKIGKKYLIPLLLETQDTKNIVFSKLPKKFIIKANHGSGMNIIVKDKSKENIKDIRKICNSWLKSNFYYLAREWQYKDITPRILIEKLLLDEKGETPADYKFNCFHGKVKFIQVDTNRFVGRPYKTMYTPDWKLAYFNWCERGTYGEDPANDFDKNIKKPKQLKKMIKLSEKLSEDFDYVRVDLYECRGKIYFGELTFSNGAGYVNFFPKKYDRIFGEMLKLDLKKANN